MRSVCPLLIFLLLLPGSLAAQSFTGQVVAVEEGDVLRILRDTNVLTVQLYGIDTPEIGQPYGREATQYMTSRVLRDTVTVVVKEIEGRGPLSGMVHTSDGALLNAELLREGLAWWHNREAPDVPRLQAFEREARNAKRRIWSQYHPIAPWKWRAGRSSSR